MVDFRPESDIERSAVEVMSDESGSSNRLCSRDYEL